MYSYIILCQVPSHSAQLISWHLGQAQEEILHELDPKCQKISCAKCLNGSSGATNVLKHRSWPETHMYMASCVWTSLTGHILPAWCRWHAMWKRSWYCLSFRCGCIWSFIWESPIIRYFWPFTSFSTLRLKAIIYQTSLWVWLYCCIQFSICFLFSHHSFQREYFILKFLILCCNLLYGASIICPFHK